MLSKNDVKYIQSLAHKKTRVAERVFLAEGEKIIKELAGSGFEIIKLFALKEWIAENDIYKKAIMVTEDELKRISNLQTPNKVLGIVQQPASIKQPDWKNGVHLMLDGIQDPGNLGTIIRTADWFGIRTIIASKDTVDLFNPKVIQATMGSFIRVQIFYQDLHPFLTETTLPVYGAMLNGQAINTLKKISAGILIIGNEGKGISADLIPFINHKITIPPVKAANDIQGAAESLNAAVAAGIILSHIT